jgi:hypothetical protein
MNPLHWASSTGLDLGGYEVPKLVRSGWVGKENVRDEGYGGEARGCSEDHDGESVKAM